MKKTIKKVLCTTLAAVSISALVAIPSSLNASDSKSAIVNFMEVDAAKKQARCVDYPVFTAIKKGVTREKPDRNAKKVSDFNKYDCFVQYGKEKNFIKVRPDTVNIDEGQFLKNGWLYMGGKHLVKGCYFRLIKGQTSRKEPYYLAANDKHFSKDEYVDIQKFTLERCVDNPHQYRIWGYCSLGCWVILWDKNWSDMMVAENELIYDLKNMKHKASNFYVVK